jgi:hypothetical protein
MRYPPYDEKKFFWAKQIAKKRGMPTLYFVSYIPLFLLGLLLGFLVERLGWLRRM